MMLLLLLLHYRIHYCMSIHREREGNLAIGALVTLAGRVAVGDELTGW